MRKLDLLEILNERHTANEYPRKWNKETGLWEYAHRKKLGLGPKHRHLVVHHKNGDINDYSKRNLQAVSRAEHAALGKPALKHEKCTVPGCNEKHFGKGYCRHHYFEKYHK